MRKLLLYTTLFLLLSCNKDNKESDIRSFYKELFHQHPKLHYTLQEFEYKYKVSNRNDYFLLLCPYSNNMKTMRINLEYNPLSQLLVGNNLPIDTMHSKIGILYIYDIVFSKVLYNKLEREGSIYKYLSSIEIDTNKVIIRDDNQVQTGISWQLEIMPDDVLINKNASSIFEYPISIDSTQHIIE